MHRIVDPGNEHAPAQGARRRLADARERLEPPWAKDVLARLRSVDFGNAIVLLGAALLLTALPLVLLLSSIANQRIDDDLSRHIGLNSHGAHIFEGLFRKTPAPARAGVVLGVIVALAGTVTVVSSLQALYEDVFAQQHRGWRDLPRFAVWILVMLAALTGEALYDNPLRAAAGPLLRALVSFVIVTCFLWWTMHFLLVGRVPWRRLWRPALVTGLLWVGFALFSSLYFSSAIIAEHRLYGTIGVMFILATWLIAVGAVIVLGAVLGAAWQEYAERPRERLRGA